MFKLRVKAYERRLGQTEGNQTIGKFQEEHEKFDSMIKSYFTLFAEPNKFHQVMEDLNQQVASQKPIVYDQTIEKK